MKTFNLTEGAIEAIVNGTPCDEPTLQVISSKKISSGNSDRYRLLLSDGKHTYSHAMLATQLNEMMDNGDLDNNAVIKAKQYICNTLAGDRRVMIVLELEVLAKGEEVGERLGNPQSFKPGQASSAAPSNGASAAPPAKSATSNGAAQGNGMNGVHSPPAKKPGFNIRGGSTPGTPGASRIHSILSLTPYQNRWRIRARVTQKSNIKSWSNSRGEGRLFNVNLLDESGEIRATGFTDVVDKYYQMLEVNKVYYISKANLKTANKQYSSLPNDYEMNFTTETIIEPCDDDADDLPSMSFDFVKIDQLESKQPNSMIDIVGVVRSAADVSTVTGRQSQKEISKRDVQIADQSGMVVNLTLWGNDAETFKADGNPVVACKGCRLSDWGGRSLSLLSSSQMIVNPDIREAHLLKGWWDREGQNSDFQGYRSENQGSGGSSTNWKTFGDIKNENIGHEKPEYFTSKGTIIFLRRENVLYQACPTDSCNKKLVDQGNGMYRCEKCNKTFPNFKYRMILSLNLADHTDNQWVTCFQESAETILGMSAEQIGQLKESDEVAYDNVFNSANFKTCIFKLRAKMETYNEESRLKTVCMNATPLNFVEDGQRLITEINNMLG